LSPIMLRGKPVEPYSVRRENCGSYSVRREIIEPYNVRRENWWVLYCKEGKLLSTIMLGGNC